MEFERTSMTKIAEIERLILAGQTDRQIARALHCRRSMIAKIRAGHLSGEILVRDKSRQGKSPPGWALRVDWSIVERDLREGHQIKRIWEEVASEHTSHPNFFKYVKTRFAALLQATVTLRTFKAGEYCEVDYAGDTIKWLDRQTGGIRAAHVFVGILCFSQKIFAIAHENEKKPNWLDAHRRMFEFYGAVPHVVVPDCLKNGVLRCHRYDPDLNLDYVELTSHYGAAVVPARPRSPKDKALVEGAVGILMRYFRFVNRRRTFTSLTEINQALSESLSRLNAKPHSRFKVSRDFRFETLEKSQLRRLPAEPWNAGEWKRATLHPDCTVSANHCFYSAPHIYRGKELRVKVSAEAVEIFLDLDRVAVHPRAKGSVGERIIKNEHLPENSRAYLEATPQMLLAQARFSHPDLHSLIHELFELDTLGNLRRAQGLVRKAYVVIQAHGREKANPWLVTAIAQMRRFNRIRVRNFEEIIQAEIKKATVLREDRTIVRQPGNPMVRGHGKRAPSEDNETIPVQLRLI